MKLASTLLFSTEPVTFVKLVPAVAVHCTANALVLKAHESKRSSL